MLNGVNMKEIIMSWLRTPDEWTGSRPDLQYFIDEQRGSDKWRREPQDPKSAARLVAKGYALVTTEEYQRYKERWEAAYPLFLQVELRGLLRGDLSDDNLTALAHCLKIISQLYDEEYFDDLNPEDWIDLATDRRKAERWGDQEPLYLVHILRSINSNTTLTRIQLDALRYCEGQLEDWDWLGVLN